MALAISDLVEPISASNEFRRRVVARWLPADSEKKFFTCNKLTVVLLWTKILSKSLGDEPSQFHQVGLAVNIKN